MAKTDDDGLQWLNEQLRLLGIDRAELARRGDFNQSTLTHVYAGRRRVGRKLAQGIARGLGVGEEVVYREFGLMSERGEPVNEEEAQLFTELLDDIEDIDKRREAVGLVTALLRHVAITTRRGKAQRSGKGAGSGGKAHGRAATAD